MDEENINNQYGLQFGRWKLQELASLSEQIMEESEYETLHTENLGVHMLAGAFAGIMEHCVMYPVDFVKVYFIFSLIKIKRFHNKSDTIFLPTIREFVLCRRNDICQIFLQ
jgi:hypothetical protein